MKREKSTARWTRNLLAVGLLVLAGVASARAQVIPTVCFDAKPVTLTRTLSNSLAAGQVIFSPEMTQAIPIGFYKVVFNPDGATKESFPISYVFSNSRLKLSRDSNVREPPFLNAHAAGETVLLISDGQAVFGYNNAGSTAVTSPRGVSSQNYFYEGPLVYTVQPSVFQPGIHGNIVVFSVVSGYNVSWFLNGSQATSTASAAQGCGTITYQGRLSDAGNSANGQYDLQFQAFDAETGGIAQSELIALENVPVTNGVFTVPLKFGSTLTNNQIFNFLEIGVRPGTSTGAFTVLTPRQPIASVPYAVNAQNAVNAMNVSGGSVQLPLTTNAPPNTECNEAAEYGRQKVDATSNRLYICTATGWKFTALQ